ncbi:MAG: UDP-N-acetylmuramoyl-L-alanyl-D-glutamate--2,6-diaminopimelate ligase [Methylotenera sp.]|nr:UDP-N-acetylmuramoyl-L-alanyl-D-glutamate--2,6-diaminopimelate ligase [Methylotenera sp.]
MTILTSLTLGALDRSFASITSDSRSVQAGSLFLAYPGVSSDGRHFIPQAIKAGAKAVIWEEVDFTWQADWQVSNISVKDLKQQAGIIAAEFYQNPSRKLTMIGVTGTNGKTSVSQWIAQCLTLLGRKTAVLGTIGNGMIGNGFLDTQTEAVNTTPDAILLQGMLAGYVQQQADAVVMEVSSHGLDQGRLNGVEFDIAVLTNLSRDHLDYHKTMEAYAAAKQKLFVWDGLGMAIVNVDDAFGHSLASTLKTQAKPCMTYGFDEAAAKIDVAGSHLKLHDTGFSMQVTTPQGGALLIAPVLGRFNAYNVLAVLATLLTLDVSLTDAVAVIAKIKPVQGRMQQFGGGNLPLVVVDYAHTPDALEKVLSTLKEQAQGKLICVFGCGGDRDAGKRPLMGAVASKFADMVIVTTDNPRSEDPAAIIREIVSNMHTDYELETDREVAINKAVESAKLGDIVLLAGKGHENYQEISGVKYPFDDALIAQAALRKHQVTDDVRASA